MGGSVTGTIRDGRQCHRYSKRWGRRGGGLCHRYSKRWEAVSQVQVRDGGGGGGGGCVTGTV